MVTEWKERIPRSESAANLIRAAIKQSQFETNGANQANRTSLRQAQRVTALRFPAWGRLEAAIVCVLYLLTEQTMRLYAWRRQAELLLRARRHAVGMLLFINGANGLQEANERALAIPVFMFLFGSLSLIILKQQTAQWSAVKLVPLHPAGSRWCSIIRIGT